MGENDPDREYQERVAILAQLWFGDALARLDALPAASKFAVAQELVLRVLAALPKPDRRALARMQAETVLREGGWHGPFSVLHR